MHHLPSCDDETLSKPVPVLVVEDEYLPALDLEQALTRAGFVPDIVSSSEEALTRFIGRAITYRALVTDVHLHGSVCGWELARRIREKDPAFPVIYVTAAPAKEWASQGVPNSILISKPFARAQLVTALASLLNIGTPPIA
jgi:DNA-binding response OmpR family regulator